MSSITEIAEKTSKENGEEPETSKNNKRRQRKKTETKKVEPKKKEQKKAAFVKKLAGAVLKADEEKRAKEEEERKKEEERLKELERLRLEEEKREQKRQKERERKKRRKEEGKILNKYQKEKKNKNKEALKKIMESGQFKNEVLNINETQNEEIIKPLEDKEKEVISKVDTESETSSSAGDEKNDIDENIIDDLSKLTIRAKPTIADPVERIKTRVKENEENRNKDILRSPIISVFGHVDTGKTSILDTFRKTRVQGGEAGGITQQIGVTNVPLVAIKSNVCMCKNMDNFVYRIPGLSIIDTPGHYSFKNLRKLGSNLCDIGILIVDLMHSVEQQTIESMKLLVSQNIPFIVVLNKIDLLIDFKSMPNKSIIETLESQSNNTKNHFHALFNKVFVDFASNGLNLALFNEMKDINVFIPAIPTSAKSGDGIGDLIAYICEYAQTYIVEKLWLSKELDATVMEVKVIAGHGPTIDVILVSGKLCRGDRMIVPGINGAFVSQIRALLIPQPMKEMRVKGNYISLEYVNTSQGVKIAGSNLDEAIAGFPIYVAQYEDEVEYYKEKLDSMIKKTLNSFDKKDKGVYVQASTLGSLEALLDFLNQSKIPYCGVSIGPVHKRDVISTMTMLEHNELYAVILAFDVKVDSEAQTLADKVGVKIFTAEIIYHLFDKYIEYEKSYKKAKANEFKHLAIFPCLLKILPNCVYKTRDPIVVGVMVEEGSARVGTPLCVPSKNCNVGVIGSIEVNHKSVEVAKKGQEVCIKILNIGEETPKLVGRHFEISDQLVSKISRESIDVLKDYYRDEVSKAEWILIKNLKNVFNII